MRTVDDRRPATVAEYIEAAPEVARPHLRRLRAILRSAAPHATELIKWGNPFYVEPRFLFAFSAHKAHCSLAPSPAALKAFARELKPFATTKNFLKLPYDQPIPEALVRRIAEFQVDTVRQREDDGFW